MKDLNKISINKLQSLIIDEVSLHDFNLINNFLISFNQSFSLEEMNNKSKKIIPNLDFLINLISVSNDESNFINRLLDNILGLNYLCPEVHKELKLKNNSNYFNNISSYYHFCLSYQRLVKIFKYLSPIEDELIIDLGSGYGRVGQFIGHFYPTIKMLGLELTPELVKVSSKLSKIYNFKNIRYLNFNLLESNCSYPIGKYYFFYDAFVNDETTLFFNKIEKIFLNAKSKVYLVIICGWSDDVIKIMDKKNWAHCVHIFKEYENNSPIRIYSN